MRFIITAPAIRTVKWRKRYSTLVERKILYST